MGIYLELKVACINMALLLFKNESSWPFYSKSTVLFKEKPFALICSRLKAHCFFIMKVPDLFIQKVQFSLKKNHLLSFAQGLRLIAF